MFLCQKLWHLPIKQKQKISFQKIVSSFLYFILFYALQQDKLMSILIQSTGNTNSDTLSTQYNSYEPINYINSFVKIMTFKHNLRTSINNACPHSIHLLVQCDYILPTYTAVISIKIDLKTLLLTAQAYFIFINTEKIVTIQTKSMRICCIKAINKNLAFTPNGQFLISLKSGQLKYRFSTIHLKTVEKSFFYEYLEDTLKYYISDIYSKRQKLAVLLSIANLNTFSMPINNVRIGYLKSLGKILGLFNVTPTFQLTEGSAVYKVLVKLYQREQLQIKEIMNRIQSKFLEIFCRPFFSPQNYKKLMVKDLKLTILQRKRLREMVLMPVVGRTFEADNIYITNEIKIKMPISDIINIPSTGSFGDLSLTKLTFSITNDQDGEQMQNSIESQKNKYITKTILWKKSNNKKVSLQKVRHELNIIKTLKNATSAFLPKYYITNEKLFADSILLDFYKGLTLLDYFIQNKESISLWTKIHLVYNVTQGLRYLKRYNIVHMDIKPSNLIVTKWLIVKIIDFGQSYHPEVCSSSKFRSYLAYNPGFTYPYVSPQIYLRKNIRFYNQKQDVYALGIILYELLFQHFPFKVSRKRFKQACEKGQLHLITEIIAQQGSSIGQQAILLVLMQVIMRCLNQNSELRPYVDWVALILRECISYYKDC